MLIDICSCPISLTQTKVLDDWNAMIRAFLAHGAATPDYLGKVIGAAPDFAMAQAAKGLFCLMLGRREMIESARAASQSAQAALAQGGATDRERLWCQALQDWLDGHPSHAVRHMEEALRQNPTDTFSMKVSHAIRFILGDNHGMRRSIDRVIAAHGPDHALRGYAYGCLAFAQEETGDYDLAERSGLMALQYAPDDAWGLHAVAHVHDMTHDPARGIALIENNMAAWTHCNNFRFHVWWHKALLHLDQGDHDTVLALYDAKIRDEKTDDYRDFSNASSLLMRLELEGISVGDRWAELADLAETRSADGCLVFADLHYLLALSGDGRDDAVAHMLARVAADATGAGEQAAIMRDPGQAASLGLAAFGEARYDTAFQHLRSARQRFQTMGGSHAQRDVFERVTIEAGLRAGQLDATEALIRDRIALRNGAVDQFASARLETLSRARIVAQGVAAQ